ncbi:hypothetical protein DFA_07996 [Cavenderia fasciculata]|uniref:Uncharacterized protein n=1 Tax=Cavenderia fasciculata TaxID=261658 RepID=F4Q4K6_CACFS|nr:uncharacterized protein DFA_07996 [Cavenderia fasciculata]EGG17015.1 hypothetical protein DFA_07996 [Cavenderia fasciculata]|eukprot:XP_004355499.1 hypothetical protein DFA_07996 [Cavenderia fasciculata]
MSHLIIIVIMVLLFNIGSIHTQTDVPGQCTQELRFKQWQIIVLAIALPIILFYIILIVILLKRRRTIKKQSAKANTLPI